MMVYLRSGSKCYWLTITTKQKEYKRFTTGTHNKAVAEDMQLMVDTLGRRGSRDWDIIDAIVARRLTVPDVYDAWKVGDLDAIRAKLSDVNLAPDIDAWATRVSRELKPNTVRKYLAHVAVLFPVDDDGARLPVYRSTITPAWLKQQLAAVPGSNTNRARHYGAWRSVFNDLVEHGHFDVNPLDRISAPAPNTAKTPHIDALDDVIRLVNAHPEGKHRAMAALREGAGLEWQAIQAMRRSDILDDANRIVWAHGDKTETRDRQAQVDEWAWPIVMAYVRSGGFLPDAPLFPGTYRWMMKHHVDACAAMRTLGVRIPADYTPHNARNSAAIRWLKEGRDEWWVANQLGHSTTDMVRRRYGKFKPKALDVIKAGQRYSKQEGGR